MGESFRKEYKLTLFPVTTSNLSTALHKTFNDNNILYIIFLGLQEL